MDSLEFSIFCGIGDIASVPTAATGTVTITDYANIADDTTLTIVTNNYTCGEGSDWVAETSNDVTAANIAAAITSGEDEHVTAVAVANVVTLTAKVAGTAGNSISLATTDAVRVAISGNTLSGGTD